MKITAKMMKPCSKTFTLKVCQNFDFLTEKSKFKFRPTHILSSSRLLRILSKKYPAASARGMGGSRRPRGEAEKIKETFLKIAFFWPLKVKISKKSIKYMQKFSKFYVTYRNIVQFDHDLGKLDYFEKSVLKLMASPVQYLLKGLQERDIGLKLGCT